jgi:hypothetical protein
VPNPTIGLGCALRINGLHIDDVGLCRRCAIAPHGTPRQPPQLDDDAAVLDAGLQLRRQGLGDEAGEDLPVLHAALGSLYEPAGEALGVARTRRAGQLDGLLDGSRDLRLDALRAAGRVAGLAGLERGGVGAPGYAGRGGNLLSD